MKKINYGLFLFSFFTTSCVSKGIEKSNTDLKTKENPSPSQNKKDIDSSTNNNSSKNNSSNNNLKNLNFENNILTTPLFKLRYEDSEIINSNKKSKMEKQNFLSNLYKRFIENSTYGNEVYSIKEIIFLQEEKNDINVLGEYNNQTRTISVYFDSKTKVEKIFSTLNHEYYHHLTVSRIEKLKKDQIDKKNKDLSDIDNYSFNKFQYIFNDGDKQLDNNYYHPSNFKVKEEGKDDIIGNIRHFWYLLIETYNYEVEQYYEKYFKVKKNDKFITFKKEDVPIMDGIKALDLRYHRYVNQSDEFFSRNIDLYTRTKVNQKDNKLMNVIKNDLENYLMQLFIRTNLYYSYTNLQRKFPRTLWQNKNSVWIEDKDQLTWKDIKEFEEESIEKMKEKYLVWKNYFENILYNQNQLLSSAFIDEQKIFI